MAAPQAPKSIKLNYSPRKWQQELHTHRKRFSIVALHRQGGKTEAAVMELIDCAVQARTELPMFAYVAPELRQARTVMWPRLKQKLRPVIDAGGAVVNESDLSIQLLSNGATIRLFGASDPDALRGMTLDGVVIDEVAQMKTEAWEEVISPMLFVRKGWALFIGTPKGVNLFSSLYSKAVQNPEWYARTWTCYQTGALAEEEIARSKAQMSPMRFAREMLCDFNAQADDQLIPLSLAVDASRRSYNPNDRAIGGSPVILGVDPARFGEDRSVIVRRQGLCCFEPLVFQGIDNMDLAAKVAREINAHRPAAVFIDAGAGAGVIDRLRQLGHRVVEVPFGGKATTAGFLNRRAEMWWKTKKWLETGGMLPQNDVLVKELATPVYWYDSKDQVVLEPKDSIRERLGVDGGGSPDIADALCLTHAADVGPVLDMFEERLTPQRQAERRYHPFARGNGRR